MDTIAVIIPTYNGASTLQQCLDSVVAQTMKPHEIVVVDDGSDMPELIQQIVGTCSRPVQLIRQANQGAPAARNLGFAHTTASLVIFVDDDAVLQPSMLQTMYETLQQHPQASFCYSSFFLGKKLMKYIPFATHTLRHYNYIHTTSLMHRDAFIGFDESLKKFQDWDLWLSIIAQGGSGIGVDQPLFTIIKPHGTMSVWLPAFVYRLPWPLFGYTPKPVARYQQAQMIIAQKHGLESDN